MVKGCKLPFEEAAVSANLTNAAVTTTKAASPSYSYDQLVNQNARVAAVPNNAPLDVIKNGVQADTKCKLRHENNVIKVMKCVNGDIYAAHTIIPEISSVKVYSDKYDNPRSMTMTFENGKSVTASVDGEDVFSVYQGITICLLKYMIEEKASGCATSVYNKLVDHAYKVLEKTKADELTAKAEAKRLEEKHAKAARKKLRRKNRKREYEIELRKEAYIRAMNELSGKAL